MRKSISLAVGIGFVIGLVAQSQQIIVPANYRALVANTAPANKADLLAQGVLTVQDEAMAAERDVVTLRTQAGQTLSDHGQRLQSLQQAGADHEQRIKMLEQEVPPIVQHIQAIEKQNLQTQLDAIQRQLNELRTAVCPALKNTKLKDTDKAKIDGVCQSGAAADAK